MDQRSSRAPIGRLPSILERIGDELWQPEELLYLDPSGQGVMIWRRDQNALRRGEYPFVVGVHFGSQQPLAVTAEYLSTLTAHYDATSATSLEKAFFQLQEFHNVNLGYDGTLGALRPGEWLYIDPQGHVVMMWRRDVLPLRRGEYTSVVGADLTDRQPIEVTPRYLSTLRDDFEHIRGKKLGEVLSEIVRFRTEEHRYHGALDARLSGATDPIFIAMGPPRARIRWSTLSGPSIVGPSMNAPAERLDATDVQLINRWSPYPPDRQLSLEDLALERSDRFRLNRHLIYARMAEKFVLDFYTHQLRRRVKDVSVRQLDGGDSSWMTHDIAADIPIDVKNATIFGARRRHNFVERFKRTGGRDVHIAGVLTEFPRSASPGIRQAFLGLVSLADVERAVWAVNELPGRAGPVRLSFDSGYIPPWAFELDAYRERYEIDAAWFDVLITKPDTRIAVAIAGGKARESSIYLAMNGAQRGLVDRLLHVIDRASYRKMSIALFTISEFLAALQRGCNGSAVIQFIRRLISVEAPADSTVRIAGLGSGLRAAKSMRETYRVRLDLEPSQTGGLYDPTKSLIELLDLLERAGDGIARSHMKLEHFDAPSPYMLLARTTGGRKVTVYAYCGGTNDAGYACERFPLIMGYHATCDGCGRLVCDDCGFCSEGCIHAAA